MNLYNFIYNLNYFRRIFYFVIKKKKWRKRKEGRKKKQIKLNIIETNNFILTI